MGKTITVTLKIDRDKKQAFYNFCQEQGLMVNKFIEKAVENEIERRLLEKSASVFHKYEKRKQSAVDFDKAVKKYGKKG